MKFIALNVPDPWVKKIDELVYEGKYPNRSEAIRLFIRDGLKAEGKL